MLTVERLRDLAQEINDASALDFDGDMPGLIDCTIGVVLLSEVLFLRKALAQVLNMTPEEFAAFKVRAAQRKAG